MKRKVLAFTSIRADYNLMSGLYSLLNEDIDVDFKIIVSGAHLSHQYGYSYQEIVNDGLEILFETETLLNYDTKKSKLKSASILLQNSIDIVAQYSPDVIIYAGDREDVMVVAMLGVFLKIPTIHFYGGDHEKAGHEDTVIRHAVSKLSTFHFVACAEHSNRLLAIGEGAHRIFNIGSVALDKFKSFKKIHINEILKKYNKKENSKIALVIYHPSPDEAENTIGDTVILRIITCLQKRGLLPFVSSPNTDFGNKKIVDVIHQFTKDDDVVFFDNLNRDTFLSLFTQSALMIGNSSAGMLESTSIPIPAINVGLRQKDRLSAKNVLFCSVDEYDILNTIEKAISLDFLDFIKDVENPYGDGNSTQVAKKLIKTLDLKQYISKIEDPLYD